MQVPVVILADVYSLLCEYGEKPIMNESMFIDGFKQGWIYIYGIQCKTMDFHCKSPLRCKISLLPKYNQDQESIDKHARLNADLDKLTDRHNKIMLFW